jgi:hypothetical protein
MINSTMIASNNVRRSYSGATFQPVAWHRDGRNFGRPPLIQSVIITASWLRKNSIQGVRGLFGGGANVAFWQRKPEHNDSDHGESQRSEHSEDPGTLSAQGRAIYENYRRVFDRSDVGNSRKVRQ